MTEKIGLEALLKDDQFQAGLKRYMTGLDAMVDGGTEMIAASKGLVKATDEVGDSMTETGTDAVTLAAQMDLLQNAFDAVRQIAQEGLELAKLGATAERIEQRFDALSVAAGGSEVILQAFQDGAGGAASKMEAMQSASKLLQMGLVTNADEMEKVVEMASRLGDQTQSVGDRVQDFALMLANQSIPRLDNFGISSGRVRARMAELKAETAGMSRETAFMIATMEAGDQSLGILGDRVDDNAMAFEKAEAKMADMRVELGQKLAPAFAAVMDVVSSLETETIMLIAVAGSLLGIILKFGPALKAAVLGMKAMMAGMSTTAAISTGLLAPAIIGLVVAFNALMKANKGVNEAAAESVEVAKTWSQQAADMQAEGRTLTETMFALSDKSNEMNRIWNDNVITGSVLGVAFGTHNKFLQTAAELTAQVNQAAIESTSTWAEYAAAIDTYNANTNDANLKVTALTEAEFGLARAALPEVVAAAAAADQAMLNHVAAIQAGIVKSSEWVAQIQFTAIELGAMDAAAASSDAAMLGLAAAYTEGTVVTDEHEAALRRDYYALQQEEAALLAAKEAEAQAREELNALIDAHNRATQAAFNQTQSVLSLAESLSGLDEQQTARAAIEQLEELFNTGVIGIAAYDEEVRQIQDTFGLVSEQGRFLAEGFELLKEAVASGVLVSDDYSQALSDMQAMAEEGETDLDALKEVIEGYREPTEDAATETDTMAEAMRGATERGEEQRDAIEEAAESADRMIVAAEDLAVSEDDLAEAIDSTQGPLTAAIASTDDLAAAMGEAQSGPIADFIATMEDLPAVITASAEAMYSAGQAIVQQIQRGIKAAWPALMSDFDAALAALRALLPGSRPDDPSSPLYDLPEAGAAMVEMLESGILTREQELSMIGHTMGHLIVEGLRAGLEEGESLMRELSGAFGVFSALGKTAAGMLLDPAQARYEGMVAQIESLAGAAGLSDSEFVMDDLAAMIRATGTRGESLGDIMLLADIGLATDEQLELVRIYRQLQPLHHSLTDAAADYAEQQERILALQEAQQQMKFLEQQMALLDLIAEHGLDAEQILGGIELGLDADLADVVDAMVAAMNEIIDAAEQELDISSPSRVFARIGQQTMVGMAAGIESMLTEPMMATAAATRGMMSTPAAMMGAASISNVDRSQHVSVSAGGNNIHTGMDQAQFEARVMAAVRRGLQGVVV